MCPMFLSTKRCGIPLSNVHAPSCRPPRRTPPPCLQPFPLRHPVPHSQAYSPPPSNSRPPSCTVWCHPPRHNLQPSPLRHPVPWLRQQPRVGTARGYGFRACGARHLLPQVWACVMMCGEALERVEISRVALCISMYVHEAGEGQGWMGEGASCDVSGLRRTKHEVSESCEHEHV